MEVRELRNLLAELDDDAIVVLACDSEGNEYRPLDGFNSEDYVFDYVDFCISEAEEGDKPCLVLWPS